MGYPTVELDMFNIWQRYKNRDLATLDYYGGTVTDLNNINILFNRDLPILVSKGIVSRRTKLYQDTKKFYNHDIVEFVDTAGCHKLENFNLLNKIFHWDFSHFFNRTRLLRLYHAEIENQ